MAATILAICVLAIGRPSDTQVSAYAVPVSSEAAQPAALTNTASRAYLPLPREAGPLPLQETSPPSVQIAVLVPPPASVLTAALSAAEPTPQTVAVPITPSAKERVSARDKAPTTRSAKLRKPVRKAPASETAPTPPPAEPVPAPLTGRSHAPGRYEMRWGTARLHEDPNSDRAEGPSWDFVASAGTR